MNNQNKISSPFVAALLLSVVAGMGCHDRVRSIEVDTRGPHGEVKHEETKVYKNSDGTTIIEKEKRVTN